MQKLGFTDFINKHLSKFLIAFAICILLIFISPKTYNLIYFSSPVSAMRTSFYMASVSIILTPIGLKQFYYHLLEIDPSSVPNTFNEYAKSCSSTFVVSAIQTIIFWFTIISLIIVLIQHFKHKKITKPLLYLPLAFYICYVLVEAIANSSSGLKSLTSIPFVGFYLAIIVEVLVILYCAGFQRFRKPEPRPHKPTDKERIAELERQVAELQKEKDAK